jgi:transposase
MSTRCYDTDLDDAAWAWIAPYLPTARSGGRPRTTDLRAVLNPTFSTRRQNELFFGKNRLPRRLNKGTDAPKGV